MAAIHLNNEQFYQLIHNSKPILVDFWASWCGYCRRIGPVYDKLADEYKETVILAKLNVDDFPQLAETEQIEVLPTLVLYQNGQALDSIVAPDSKAKIETFLKEALGL